MTEHEHATTGDAPKARPQDDEDEGPRDPLPPPRSNASRDPARPTGGDGGRDPAPPPRSNLNRDAEPPGS